MPGDYSRFTHDPKKRFAEVLAQQGRVDLDSDRNELVEILNRADVLRAHDTFGNAAVPRATTPDAFRITPSGNDLTIGAGRMYVDGILIENFADENSTYNKQPFLAGQVPPAFTQFNGETLVYVDVWQREITHIEDPDLLDSALGGVDTATRLKTIWQVKLAPKLDCESDLAKAFPPTDAKLTVKVTPPKDPPDPCLLPESGGFTDIENRHYRVEVHVRPPGDPNPGTFFKFSRDPIGIEVESIQTATPTETTLVVKSVGRDSVLRVSKGDTIEFTNELRVLNNIAGTIARVTAVDDGARLVTVDTVLTSAEVDKIYRPRLIVWHQKPSSPTELLIPIDTTKDIDLEAGISVRFEGSDFHHGDSWMFPARAATHVAGPLVSAPPRGIVHHYAPLATLNLVSGQSTSIRDCRNLWPAECDCECECDACVNEHDHAAGAFTIQMAIDQVKKSGNGGRICIKPGLYVIDKPIELTSASFISVVGHGSATIHYTGKELYAIIVEASAKVSIEGLNVMREGAVEIGDGETDVQREVDAAAILIRNCLLDIAVRGCLIVLTPALTQGIGIAFEGAVFDVVVDDCFVIGGYGAGTRFTGGNLNDLNVAGMVDIANNMIMTRKNGVQVLANGVAVAIHDNWILSAEGAGIMLEGTTDPGLGNTIERNHISAFYDGISIASDRTTIANNSVRGSFTVDPEGEFANAGFSGGIVLESPHDDESLETIHILANQVREIRGAGILVKARTDGCMIKQNFVTQTAGAGIALNDNARESHVTIENNELRDVALGDDFHPSSGIRIAGAANVAIVENTITNVSLPFRQGREPLQSFGIYVEAPALARVHGNRIEGITGSNQPSAGIAVISPVGALEVTSNIVQVTGAGDAAITRHAFPFVVSAAQQQKFKGVPVKKDSEALYVIVWMDGGLAVAPPSHTCVARANQFFTTGMLGPQTQIVFVEDPELNCTFGGNVVNGTATTVGVFLHADTIVADSNQVLAPCAVGLHVATPGQPEHGRYTVLGNIVAGKIELIPAETSWLPLNRMI
ncbi:MAG: DUF6519 domain-containing protein [Acidobacteriota bacterium]|nr:DUF6519 domain-containing protein [Acidobacteriota bacterium]